MLSVSPLFCAEGWGGYITDTGFYAFFSPLTALHQSIRNNLPFVLPLVN